MVMAAESHHSRPGVFGMYMVKQQNDPDYFIGGRILHPQWIDNHLPSLWKSTCNHEHGNTCRKLLGKSLSTTRPTWLVDVDDGCLVPAPEDCSYVALSYVWGHIQTLHATQSSIQQLQEKGALYRELKTPIAATIVNAMGVVSLLGEKYLWVDTLCIVQDDSTQKHTEMAKMSGIYANASVTILAVQGDHANSGLRGFQGISLPRNLRQSVHRLEGGEIVTMHPLSHVSHDLGVDSPTWESRGWTYQENIFSERRLIFNGDSIRWECPSSVMSELVETLRHIEPTHFGIRGTQALFEPSIPDLYGLQLILRDYNSRAFTYPEDALNAFAGMAYSFSLAFGGCFVSGLPSAFFGLAILWQPSERILRRVARDKTSARCLPSWSWAGWSGRIEFECTSAADFIRNGTLPGAGLRKRQYHVTPILKWKYHETKDSPGIEIDANILQARQDWIEGLARISEGWTEHDVFGSPKAKFEPPNPRKTPKTYFKHASYPAHQFWYPIPLQEQKRAAAGVLAPYISCQTRRATLYVEQSGKQGRHGRILSLQNQDGSKLGMIQLHENLEAGASDSRIAIELVEVGFVLSQQPYSRRFEEESKKETEESMVTEWFKSYKVMWVEWHNGIAYRKGLGEVAGSNWEECRGEEFTLTLG
ncbi:hypothetical protein ACLX1H_004601 [Fusarium chlamydosporum]